MARAAFVTGASSGLGRGLAVRLARAGWNVGLAARRAGELEVTASSVRAHGADAAVLPCDVADREAVRAAVARCTERLGPVDLLVANAGVGATTRAGTLDGQEVARVIQVNFLGTVYAVEAVLPAMLARGRGQIAGVSSLAAFRGLPGRAAYSASKAAQVNFLESLRNEVRRSGVLVTVITPGFVDTALTGTSQHPRPFLLDVDDAVERMYRAIRDGRRTCAFPFPLTWLATAGRVLPASVFDRLSVHFRR